MDTSYSLPDLVVSAGRGDRAAWDALVERFLPLVCVPVGRHRLSEADGDDVSQTVWLRLVEELGRRRDPAELPDWLSTTAQDECRRLLAARRRMTPAAEGLSEDGLEAEVVAAVTERRRELARAAFGRRPAEAEPMELVGDSALDADAVVRGPGDPGRRLSFGRAGIGLELEVGAGELAGRVRPAQDATVTLHHAGDDDRTVAVDDEGRFRFEGVVSGSLRLTLTTSGRALASPWVTV